MLRNIFLEYFPHLIKHKLISALLTAHTISTQPMVTMQWFSNSSKCSHFRNQHRPIASMSGGSETVVRFSVGKNSSSCQAQK